MRGLSYYNLENSDYDAALNDFNKAVDCDKNFPVAFYKQEAINNYDKAIELNYAEDYVYTERGSTKCMLHKYDDAIKDFNKALEIDVTHTDAYR